MKEFLITENTLPEAYHASLIKLQHGDITDCSDWNTTQKEISVTICIQEPLKEPMISKLFIGGPKELEQYRQEMLDGILDFEVEKGNWEYTYHDRMTNYPIKGSKNPLDQIDFVVRELTRNPSSRRAVILVRDNSKDPFSADAACLQHVQYFIRNNKLHCKVLFRSNDACKAAFMNMFALIMLQKRIADRLNVAVGTYVHRANSYHCYERDYELLDHYIDAIIGSSEDDITYDYIGEWDEIMDEYKPEIAKAVERLKANE